MNKLQIYKPFIKLLSIGLFGLVLTSCQDENSPGVEYMPDMYRSPAIEPFVDYEFPDSATTLQPPQNSIPLGYLPFAYANTEEGFEKAGKELEIPFPVTDKILKDGEVLYSRFCAHCHGAKGDGEGTITHAIYSAAPGFNADAKNRRGGRAMTDLTAGHIYHTIMYGLNAMGPHATLIREVDRWKIVAYVETLQGKDVLSKDDKQTTAASDTNRKGSMTDKEGEGTKETKPANVADSTSAQ